MKKFGLVAVVVGSSVALGAMLLIIPPLISWIALLLWSFYSSGYLLFDGYVRGIAALVVASVSLGRLVVLFPTFMSRSEFVEYAEYMVQAAFYGTATSVLVATFAASVGVRNVLKVRSSSNQPV